MTNLTAEQRTSRAQTNREMREQQKRLIRRQSLLEKIARLASELCTAVDREADDIGGSRPSLVILQEMGKLCDDLEGWGAAPPPVDSLADLMRQKILALQARCCGSDDLCNGCRALLEIANG